MISSLLPSLQLGGQFRKEKGGGKKWNQLKKKKERDTRNPLQFRMSELRLVGSVFVLFAPLLAAAAMALVPRVSARVCGVTVLASFLSFLFLSFAFLFFFKSLQSQQMKTGRQAVGGSGWLAPLSVPRTLAHTIRSDPHTAR